MLVFLYRLHINLKFAIFNISEKLLCYSAFLILFSLIVIEDVHLHVYMYPFLHSHFYIDILMHWTAF